LQKHIDKRYLLWYNEFAILTKNYQGVVLMKTARKHLRVFCIMLCIAFILVSCNSGSEDTSSVAEISHTSESFDPSGETSYDMSDEVSEINAPDVVEEKGLIFTLTEIDGALCYSVSGDSNKEKLTKVDIPSSVNDIPVRIIDDYAFRHCTELTSVTIPDGVTSIGVCAFIGCTELTSLRIPDSVTSIGFAAFSGCTSLTTVNIPDGVTTIEGDLFGHCSSLDSITIPDGATSIGNGAFWGCDSLTSINIPADVESIGGIALAHCAGLESITVSPDNEVYHSAGNCLIETQSKTLLIGCKNSVIPDDGSVTSIGVNAFEGRTDLTEITIPKGITSIGGSAFSGCSGLKSVKIPDSVETIDYGAFSDCIGLTDITLPESVTSIWDGAFGGCTGLTSITIPSGVVTIGRDLFEGCTGLENIVVSPENKALHSAGNCVIETETKTLIAAYKNSVIPDDGSVTSIGEGAFFGRTDLTEITIPDGVTSISRSAFYDCSNLKKITIPDSVTSIGEYAFGNCKGVTSLTIPSGVTSINDWAFIGCSALKSITIPDSVTSIRASALWGCDVLEKIIVSPDNKVYHSAGNCIIETAAKKLVIGCKASVIPDDGSVTVIGDLAFCYCGGLTSIEIPDCVTDIGISAFSNCSNLTSVTLPNGITKISEELFKDCTALTAITIPDSVTTIDRAAFENTGLTSITIPDSVTRINGYVCQNSAALESITVSSGNKVYHSDGNCIIETESKTLIFGCNTSVIPDDGSVTSIGNNAFYGCNELKSLTIPDSVTSIGSGAFQVCRGLTSVTIPSSVTSIEDNAFGYCELTEVTFGGTKAQWKAFSDKDLFNNVYKVVVHCADGDTARCSVSASGQ